MLNLFRSNAFSRKRKHQSQWAITQAAIECLESRVVLASQVTALYSNGNLTLNGSGDDDNLIVSVTAGNTVTLTSGGSTIFNGAGAGPFVVNGNLTINMGNGNDTVFIRVDGADGDAMLDSGTLSVDLGAGNDTLTSDDDLTFTGNVSILGGAGNDLIALGSATASFRAYQLSIDGGTDTGATSNSKTITLNGVTTGSDVTLKNRASADQQVVTGLLAANAIGGNLTVSQATASNNGYITNISNTSVVGNLQVTHGNTTSSAVIYIAAATTPVTIGGTTSLTNGNSNSASVMLTGVAAPLTLSKNITVKNGNAASTNFIQILNVTGNGTSSTFTNGTANQNQIDFSGLTTNAFAGPVSATNGNSTGNNFIFALRLSSAKGINLTNGTANGASTIQLGSGGATDAVTAGGNVVLTNANTSQVTVSVDRLTTTASGNLTIANGTTSGGLQTNIGNNGPVAISGDLSVTNQSSSAPNRSTSINQTTIGGRTGLSINNVAAGNSVLSLGTSSLVTVVAGVTIQDGGGTSFNTINSLTAANFNFNDLGGGADTLNLANSGGVLTINGVTRIQTGGGSDAVMIANGGTAVFNGLVSISLGAGNDLLNIGGNAASPAFSTANNFQFDGGTGTDTFNVNPVSLADYVPGMIPGKLKSKITGFEVII